MKFHARLNKINFDVEAVKRSLDQSIQTGVRQAARAWLRAVLRQVPVYTGTARGTMIPLGSFLRVAIPIKPVAFVKGKGPSVGAAGSHYSFATGEGGRYGFSFEPGLEYYLLNEYNLVPNIPSTPWFSFDSGKIAYDAEIKKMIKKFPKLSTFVKFSQIRVE